MKLLLIILALAVLITPVLATDYVAKFMVEKVETISGSKTWASPQTFSLNKSESKDYLSMTTVTFFDIDTSSSPVQVSIKTTGVATTAFVLSPDMTKNIKGNYYDNASASNIDDIRIKLVSLTPYSTPTTVNSTSDNPIYAYFFTDKEWSLRKDDSVSFDAKAQKPTSDSGITYSGNTALKEIYVYFKRLRTVPVSITVSSKNEPPSIWDNEKLKFTITKSDTYVFTVKYDVTNPWGSATETINKYTLIVKGLESTASTYPTAPYDVFIGDIKTVPMTDAGTFAPVNGASITPVNNNTFNIKFENVGVYNLIYTTNNGGQTTVVFNVIQKPTVQTQAQAETQVTVSANQQQSESTENGMGISNNTYLIVALIALIAGIIIYNKKYKGRGGMGGNSQYEAKRNIG